jgi:HD-like signal output (HDOD) protein
MMQESEQTEERGLSQVQAWDELPVDVRERWQKILTGIVIPPMFSAGNVYREIHEDQEAEEIAAALAYDPLLGARVLAVANSAMAGQVNRVTSLQRAVVILGFNVVHTVMLTYQLEYLYKNWPAFPIAHFEFVRCWCAVSSLLSAYFGKATRHPDRATLSTAALMARLGSLVLGLCRPTPGTEYAAMPNETSRLKHEVESWGVTSPVLSGQLARQWGLPETLAGMLERSWEPLFKEMAKGRDEHSLVLLATAAVLSSSYLTSSSFKPEAVLDRYVNEHLKANLRAKKLLGPVLDCCDNMQVRHELKALTE